MGYGAVAVYALRICLGSRSKSKNRDQQLTFVRVIACFLSFYSSPENAHFSANIAGVNIKSSFMMKARELSA